MVKKTKLLLICSIVLMVAGLIVELGFKVQRAPILHVMLPVGSILFGLFLVSRFVEIEETAEVGHPSQATSKKAKPAPLQKH